MIERVFTAYDVRAIYPSPLNEDAAWKIGHATAQFLKRSRQTVQQPAVKYEKTLVVGRDMRPHSQPLASALCDGIRSVGYNVVDIGIVDTPRVYFAINAFDCVGGIMTTASHNPVQYNGFKISGPKAKPIGASSGLGDIKRIANVLRQGYTGLQGKYETRDITDAYRRHVLKFVDIKRPLKIVIDAGNGMAGSMIPAVFEGAPNLEIIPLLFEMTGEFVHDPNPLVRENLALLQEKVRETGADLGASFDGDADRVAFVDQRAEPIGCDIITALLAVDYLADAANKGAAVVYDLRSSHAVAEAIREAGGIALRERAGHSFIKKTMADGSAVFGGEFSGHYYFRDNFYADSGAIALARVLSILSAQDSSFSERIGPLVKYSQSGEISFRVEDKDARIRFLAEQYKGSQADYLDGLTIELGDWWFNVRKSNTEPYLRLNVEANTPALLEEKLAELRKIIER